MPIARDQLAEIIAKDMTAASNEQRELIEDALVQPHLARIENDDRHDHVWVAAQRGHLVVWYDDIEGGWNVSAVRNGVIVEAGYEQDELGIALWKAVGRSPRRT